MANEISINLEIVKEEHNISVEACPVLLPGEFSDIIQSQIGSSILAGSGIYIVNTSSGVLIRVSGLDSSYISDLNSFISGLIPTNTVNTTGNQTINGDKVFNNPLSIRSLPTASTPVFIPVFTASPSGSPQVINVRTPAEIRADIGLSGVTNNAQMRKRPSSTDGYVPTWNGTSGDFLNTGYLVETTLTGSSSALVRADAIKTYVDNLLSNADAMVFKGTLGSGGTTSVLPTTYGAGWTYRVISSGTFAGNTCEVGDLIIAIVDRNGVGNLNSDWTVAQTNTDGAAPTTRILTAGSGLTGGGDLSANRTFDVGQGDGISVGADTISVDSTVVRTSGNQTINGIKTFNSIINNSSTNLYLNNNFSNALRIHYGSELSPYGTISIIPSGTNPGTTEIISNINGNNKLILPSNNGTIALITDINNNSFSGILPSSKGGTGQSSYSNGQLLIGSGSSLVANTLTAGNNINITNGSGTITISSTSSGATISNSGLNRLLISDGSSSGIVGQANLTFNGSLLAVSGNLVANTGTINSLNFNNIGDPDLSIRQLAWNNSEGSLAVGLSDTYEMFLGGELHYRVRNNTGSSILAGTAVYATGLTPGGNNRIEIAPKAADGSIREVRFMGLVTENIDNGVNGFTTHFGYIRNIDTRGDYAANGATNKVWASGEPVWAEGDILYIHPTAEGKLTKIEPKHSISVAIILNRHQSEGKLFVRPTSYGHLGDNHDVDVSGATNGQFLQYNSTTDYWVPSSSGNFTSLSVNSTGVSVSGHTHSSSDITNFNSSVSGLLPVRDIISGTNVTVFSSSGIFTINSTGGGGASVSGTQNFVSKFGSGGLGLVNSIIHDNGTNVGIGTATPAGKLDVNGTLYVGNSGVANNLYIRTGQAGVSETALRLRTDTSSNLFLDAVNAYIKVGNQSADVDIVAGNAGIRIGNNSAQTLTNQNIRFVPANTEVMRITPTGVGIGTTSPSGQLHVIGTGIFSDRLGVGTNSPSEKLHIIDNLRLDSSVSSSRITINPSGRSINVSPSQFSDISLLVNDNNIFRGLDGWTGTWADSAATTFFQVGRSAGNTIFTSFLGSQFNRLAFNSLKTVITNSASSIAIPSGYFNIIKDSNSFFTIMDGGNVGIGTGNPTSQLHVVGSGLFNGDVTANGSFIGGSGTASLPSFEFVNDPDTGLFNPAANALAISTSGVERLRVDSVGNVGIGTSVPQAGYKLDVNGAFVIRGQINSNSTIIGAATDYSAVRYQIHNGTSSNQVTYFCNGGGRFGVGFSAPSGLVAISGGVSIGAGYNLTPPTNGLIVQGNVGIGTSAPSGRFNIHAGMGLDYTSACFTTDGVATTTHIGVGNSDTRPILASLNGNLSSSIFGWGFFDRATEGDFRIARKGGSTSWADILSIRRSNGFVGIGTTIPNEALEVSGNIRLSDTGGSTGNRLQLFRGGGTAYDYTLSKEGNHIALSTANDATSTRAVQIGAHIATVWTPKIHLNGWTGAVGINNTYASIQSSMLVVRGSGNTSATSTAEFVNISNSSLFTIRDDGNVGIGTNSPQQLVHISGNIPNVGNLLRLQNGNPAQKTFVDFRIGSTGNYEDHFFIRRNNVDVFGIDNTNRGVFLESLSVFATKSLQSYNNANAFIQPQQFDSPASAANFRIGFISDANLIFLASSNERMRLTGSGNLGIGTTTPSGALHVIGSGIFSSGIIVGNGTVTNPSIVFDGSRTTGFSSTPDLLEVSVLGNRVMRMSQYGTVAINRGTGSALGILHVQGNGSNPANTSDPLIVTSSVGSGSIIRFTDSVSNDWQIGVNPNGSVATGTGSGNFAITRISSNSGVPYLTINSSGNVGIGTTNPISQLHVVGTGNFTQSLRVNNVDVSVSGHTHSSSDINNFNSSVSGLLPVTNIVAGTNVTVSSSGSTFTINSTGGGGGASVSGTQNFVSKFGSGGLGLVNSIIHDNGTNVGIGTTTPSDQLHVVGSGLFNGDVTANGSFIGGSGTAALPSFEFVNDPDTGLFSPASDTLSISTSGVERLRVNNIGAVVQTNGYFNTIDDRKSTTYLLSTTTTPSVPASELSSNGNKAIKLDTDRTYTFSILVTSRECSPAGLIGGFKLEGIVTDQNGLSIIVGTPVKTVFAKDNVAWDINTSITSVGADNYLTFTVQGETYHTTRWVANLLIVEVGTNGTGY
jgi:hypothetical protein